MTETEGWPRYFLFGLRPVRAFETPDGGLDVEAYQWETGQFAREISLATQVFMGGDEVEQVTEAEFDAAVEALRRERG